MNLIEIILEEILSDTESSDDQSEYLIETYENSQNKEDIDSCFVCLCGYQLSTLIKMSNS